MEEKCPFCYGSGKCSYCLGHKDLPTGLVPPVMRVGFYNDYMCECPICVDGKCKVCRGTGVINT